MKVLLNNRIVESSVQVVDPLLAGYDLANLFTDSPAEIIKSSTNSLDLSFQTEEKTTTSVTGFNTNADTATISVRSNRTLFENPGITGGTSDPWVLGPGFSFDGTLDGIVCDGSQAADSYISQTLDSDDLKGNSRYRLSVYFNNVTAGNVLGIEIGGVFFPAASFASYSASGFEGEVSVGAISSLEVRILVDVDFVCSTSQEFVFEIYSAYEEVIDLRSQVTWADYFDDYQTYEVARHFWFDYCNVMEDATIRVVLTCDDTTQNCYLGVLRCDRAIVLQNPKYGLAEEIKNNDIEIELLDGSVYRRKRPPQKIFSGGWNAEQESELYTLVTAINQQLGSKPLPWIIDESDMAHKTLFGGLTDFKIVYSSYGRVDFSFKVQEEI